MKKLLSLALCAILTLTMFAGCGDTAKDSGNGGSAGGSEEERTTLTVGFDAEYPPFGYMDENGDYTGFDLELAEAVCKMEGWTLKKNPIDWDSKDMELESGSVDCIWNGFTMTNLEDKYTWSDAYCDNSQVVVVAKDSGIKALTDLAGKKVGVQAASAAYKVLTDEKEQKELGDTFGELQQFKDYNAAFTDLTAGGIDALAIDIGVANYQLKQRGEGYVILDEHLNSEKYGVGFKLGNTELRDIINADMKKLLEDGTLMNLAEKYEIADMICLEAE